MKTFKDRNEFTDKSLSTVIGGLLFLVIGAGLSVGAVIAVIRFWVEAFIFGWTWGGVL